MHKPRLSQLDDLCALYDHQKQLGIADRTQKYIDVIHIIEY